MDAAAGISHAHEFEERPGEGNVYKTIILEALGKEGTQETEEIDDTVDVFTVLD